MKRTMAAVWLAGHVQIALAQPAGDPADAFAGDTPALPQVPVEPLRAPAPASAVPDPAAGPAALDEIVVTAQKKVQSLQETPISLVAFNSEQLEYRGIDGLGDLSGHVPGLAIEPFPTSNATLRLYIRGIGVIDAQVTQDPAIGLYIDGVYIARSSGNALDLADLERVEVLRGPQGTLYGRNTTGGAINLVTRRPSIAGIEFQQKFSMGNLGLLQARSSLNLPLSDTLAIKLALLGSTEDGFVENTGSGEDFGDREVRAGRLDLRWFVRSGLIADYTYELSSTDYVNPLYQAQLTPELNKGTAEFIKRYGQQHTVYSQRRLAQLATGAPMETSNTRIEGHALTLAQEFLDAGAELKYIGAWRRLSDASYTDLGGGAGSTDYRLDSHAYDGPAADLANGGPTPLMIPETTQTQWSHELQLAGSLFDERLSYIAGLFYFTEKAREDRRRLHHQLSSGIRPAPVDPVLGPLIAPGLVPADAVLPRLVNFNALDNRVANEARAAYGQATWTPDWLDARLHLTLGYRYSEDLREAIKYRDSSNYVEYRVGNDGFAVPLPASQGSDRFDDERGAVRHQDSSVSAIVEFDFTPRVRGYGKYVEAYKSGGFNTRDPQVSGASGPASDGTDYGYGFQEGFAPEKVVAYELGVKSELFGRRLRLNADVFLMDYTDMQINFLIAGTITDTKTANAGQARLTGFELDAMWLPHADLLLRGSYAYLDAGITEVIDIGGDNVAAQYQFSSAPPHAAALSADWTAWRSAVGGAVNLHAGYHYVGERLGGALADRPVRLPAYRTLALRLGYDGLPLGGGELSVALWGRNLLDEAYPINAIDNLPQADRAVIWGAARSFGLDTVYRFGR